MLKNKIFKILSILLIIGMIFGYTPVFAEDGDTQDEGTTVEESTDGTTDEGATDDGTTDEGATDDGTTDDGTTDEGTTDDGTTDEGTTDPGLTPDDILYVIDRLFEDIHLALTFDDAKKASLLLSISSERIAEAAYLITIADTGEIEQEEWNQLFQDVVDDYQAKIDHSIEVVEEAYDTDNVSKETMDQLIEEIKTSVDFDIEGLNQNEQLGEVKDKALLVANVISGLDTEQVAEIRALGVGYGQISQIFALAEASDKSVDEVAALFTEEGMGLGTAKELLGIEASELAKLKKPAKGNEAANGNSDNNTEDPTGDNQGNGIEVQLNEQTQNKGEDSQIQVTNEVKTNNSAANNGTANNSAANASSNGNKDKVKNNNTTTDEIEDDEDEDDNNSDNTQIKNNNSNNNENSNKDNSSGNGKK